MGFPRLVGFNPHGVWIVEAEGGEEVVYVRKRAAPQTIDVDAMLRAFVPGGGICDPQQVADAIRGWFASAAPQPVALTDALQRLWPAIEKAMAGLVFTAERAGEVASDMNTVRAVLAASQAKEKGE